MSDHITDDIFDEAPEEEKEAEDGSAIVIEEEDDLEDDDFYYDEEEDPAEQAQEKVAQAQQAFANAEQQKLMEQHKQRQLAQDSFSQVVDNLIETIERERRGEIDAGSGRWEKGRYVVNLDQVAEYYKRAGQGELSSRKNLLRHTRDTVRSERRSRGHIDPRERLTENEMSMASRAYLAFVQHQGSEFKVVDQLDEHGNKLTDENNDTIVKSVYEIALNKAYKLAPFVTASNRDRLLSFAWRYDEATCRVLSQALKARNAEKYHGVIDDTLDEFYTQRMEIETEQGHIAEVQLDSKEAREYLRSLFEAPKPEVKNIAIDAGLYDQGWHQTRVYASRIWQWLGNPVDEKTGLMSNSQLLERLLGPVVPYDNGFTGLIRLMVENQEMSEEAASEFLEEHQDFQPEEEES